MTTQSHRLPEPAFAEAFRAAVTARGLALQRLRDRLLREGLDISVATLSYWQSGRSRPERRDSLAALAALEVVLEVPEGSLAALLGPPRPRGRALNAVPASPVMDAFWPNGYDVDAALSEVDTRWDERLVRISQHDLVTVGADRGEESYVSRQVLRAEDDGPDRWVVIMHLDQHDRALPEVCALRHCRLGRVVHRRRSGVLVAELLFDRPLRRGETVVTEHELVNSAPYPPATNYERKFRLPVREYVLEVCFDPAALPVTCEQFTTTQDGDRTATPATVDGGTVHGVALDFGPGCYGFRWTWG